MLIVNSQIKIHEEEIEFSAIRAQGSGGQNVNKVSSAIHLRFDVRRSSLPSRVKENIYQYSDERISKDGVIIIKAQTHRSALRNRQEALERLAELIEKANSKPKYRIPTKPSRSAKKKRLDNKASLSVKKRLRSKPEY